MDGIQPGMGGMDGMEPGTDGMVGTMDTGLPRPSSNPPHGGMMPGEDGIQLGMDGTPHGDGIPHGEPDLPHGNTEKSTGALIEVSPDQQLEELLFLKHK